MLIACITTTAPSQAQTATKLTVEAISDYSYVSGGSTINDTDAVTEAEGLWNGLVGQGGWTNGNKFYDSDVWDTDFYDPELTGNAADNDQYFDSTLTAMSVFIGHGFCTGTLGDLHLRSCTSDADCLAGQYCPGGSPLPSGTLRACIAQKARYIYTSSAGSSHGNLVKYGQTYGQAFEKSLALGEDTASGAFAGVGTNGGANVALIVNSCGFRSRYAVQETAYFFAGTHSVLVTVPTNHIAYPGTFASDGFSDTAQWSARGTTLATRIMANQLAAVSDVWISPDMTTYGFIGINGAAPEGANLVMARDATASLAHWHAFTEGWVGIKYESNDAVGAYYFDARWNCNYNCWAYGW